MSSLAETLERTTTLTFDCYGTLIDWYAGLSASFVELFGPSASAHVDQLCRAYVAIEAEVEAERFRSYRDVLTEVAGRMAHRFHFDLPRDRAAAFAEMLPEWRPFPDTNDALARLKKRFRLGVLSNVDRDLFAGTCRHFDVAFDFVVTAQDVGAYKPSHLHFDRLLRDYARREEVLHIAQSVFHDGVPCGELGFAFVWINRYKDANETKARPLAEFADLKSLADEAAGIADFRLPISD